MRRGRTDPEPSGAAETEEMATAEVGSKVTPIEAAISESRAGGLVIAVSLLIARVRCLVFLLDGIGVGFCGVPVGIALVAIIIALGITLVTIVIALGIAGPRIVCVRLILPRG
jgi:hypothetical protein